MEGPPPGPGGEDITWPDQVAPRGRKTSSTRKIKPQTSNPILRTHMFGTKGAMALNAIRGIAAQFLTLAAILAVATSSLVNKTSCFATEPGMERCLHKSSILMCQIPK